MEEKNELVACEHISELTQLEEDTNQLINELREISDISARTSKVMREGDFPTTDKIKCGEEERNKGENRFSELSCKLKNECATSIKEIRVNLLHILSMVK